MALMPDEIEKCKERGKDDLWDFLWDMRIHDRAGCEKLVKELRAVIDKFDAQREDVRVHRTFWMFGAISGFPQYAPPR